MFLQGYKAGLYIASEGIAFSDERASLVEANTYQIDSELKRIFDYNSPVTVKIDGIPVHSSNYDIYHTEGKIKFNPTFNVVGEVTVSGKYCTISSVGKCHNASISIERETADVTAFEDKTRRYIKTLTSGTGSFEIYEITNPFLAERLKEDGAFLIVFYSDAEKEIVEFSAWCLITTDELGTDVASVLNRSISYQTVGNFTWN